MKKYIMFIVIYLLSSCCSNRYLSFNEIRTIERLPNSTYIITTYNGDTLRANSNVGVLLLESDTTFIVDKFNVIRIAN